MKKRILSLGLIIAITASLLSGCILFTKDNKADYAQVVATIRNVDIGNGELFSKDITKRDLVMAYLNYGQSQQQQSGATLKDTLDDMLDQLISKELIIARYTKLERNGDLDIHKDYDEEELKLLTTEEEKAAYKKEIDDYNAKGAIYNEAWRAKGYNKAWKAVYDYCDTQIASIETSLYNTKGLTAPSKGDAAAEPQYPEDTLISKFEKDQQEEIEKYTIPEAYVPVASNIPAATDKYRLDAVKRFVIMMIQQTEDISLTKDEQKQLQADKDFVNNIANKTKIYEYIMGDGSIEDGAKNFFCIRKLIAVSQFEQVKYERMQEYYNDQVEVTSAEVQKYYNDTLETQKISFAKTNSGYLNTYYTALKNEDGNTPFVFYHPTSDVFYVKHILVPFSDAQKAEITEYGKGKTADIQTTYQNGKAHEIVSYPHKDRNDDKTNGTLTIAQIMADVINTMPSGTGSTDAQRELAFNRLVHKYNTDTGIFNNEMGYIMPPQNSGIASGYMTEFEKGAYDLYNNYIVGDVLPVYATTSYGVHIMYYSSHTKEGPVDLYSFIEPMRLQTYADAVHTNLLTAKQTQNFNLVQNQIVNEYTKDDDEFYVKKYEKRYADLYKNQQ